MKLLTLNLHCFEEDTIKLNQQRIVDTIIKEDIDVVFFQEVAQNKADSIVNEDVKKSNYGYILKQALLSSGVEYDYYYKFGNLAFDKYEEGLAILSKTKLTNKTSFYISKTIDYFQWNTRIIVNANTMIEGKEINLSSIHFGWSDGYEVFENQVDKLLDNLDNDKINIIAGDFNISPGSKEYEYIIKKGYIDLFYNNDIKYYNIPTHISDIDQKHGASRIDYFMSNKEFNVISRKVIFDKDMVSDHYGVLLELELGVIK